MVETVISLMLRYLVFALMLSVGLAARLRDFRAVWLAPRVYIRALSVLEIGVPLVAVAVILVTRPPPVASTVILLMAVCPGAPFVPVLTKAKGQTHAPLGLNVLLLVSLLAPLMVPLWILVLDAIFAFDLVITPVAVLEVVVPTVIAPILLGVGIRLWFSRTADFLARMIDGIFRVGLVAAMVVLLYLGVPVLREVRPLTVLACLLVVAGAAALGFWAGSPDRETRATLSVAAVLGNPGLALAVVASSYPGLKAAALIAAYLILRALALFPLRWTLRRSPPDGRRSEAPHDDRFAATR